MKWFKHDTDANMDAKLQEVLLDYGLEGYGLYWYCVELIAGKVSIDNLNFELEHDARIIARNVGSTPHKVEEMMTYFSNLGLFENNSGTITCMKLARRLDQSMTSNPQMRKLIAGLKDNALPDKSHDSVMMKSDSVMQDQIRSDKNRDISIREENPQKEQKSKYKYDEKDLALAEWIFKGVKAVVPSAKDPNFKQWANEIRLMRERDGRTRNEIAALFQWANNDSFWKVNILSPKKLRDKWTQLDAKRGNNETTSNNGAGSSVQQAINNLKADLEGGSGSCDQTNQAFMDSHDRDMRNQMDQGVRGNADITLDSGDWEVKS